MGTEKEKKHLQDEHYGVDSPAIERLAVTLETVQNCEVTICLLSSTAYPQPPPFLQTLRTGCGIGRLSGALCLPTISLATTCQQFHSCHGRATKMNQSPNHPKMTGLDLWLCFPSRGYLHLNLAWGWCVSECACVCLCVGLSFEWNAPGPTAEWRWCRPLAYPTGRGVQWCHSHQVFKRIQKSGCLHEISQV